MASTHPEPDDLPSAHLVRRQTDRLVMDALLAADSPTRPDIARTTGISKPTVAESIRRLAALGLVVEAGKRVGGRGRSGVRYELAPDLGVAVAVHAGPGGVLAQAVDARGAWGELVQVPLGLTASAAEASAALAAAMDQLRGSAAGPVRAIVASAADPVDTAGRALLLPGSPFLTEPLDVAGLLGPGAIVGNDVNWAALAEADADAADASFFYCYLGAGIGGAIVEDGQVLVGATGLAGELAYVASRAADGSAASLLDCVLGLGVGASATVIDSDAVLRALAEDPPRATALADAVGVALGSAAMLLGVDTLVIGGPWGGAPGLLESVTASACAFSPRPLTLRAASVAIDAPFAGARLAAHDQLRRWIGDAIYADSPA